MIFAVLSFIEGDTVFGIGYATIALVGLVGLVPRSDKLPTRSVGLGTMARITGAVSVALGVAAVLLIGESIAGSIFLALLCIGAGLWSLSFQAMHRTSAGMSHSVDGEPVRACAAGVGGRGFLGGQVMAVTDRRVAVIPSRLRGNRVVGLSIPLERVSTFQVSSDSLGMEIEGGGHRITLRGSTPDKVTALATELRQRAPSGTGRFPSH